MGKHRRARHSLNTETVLVRQYAFLAHLDHEGGARDRCGVPGQPLKASDPMMTGPGGSVITLKDVHWEKADHPISVRLGGSVTSLKDVHW